MACTASGCTTKVMDQMTAPTESGSLASQRIYDKQTAERRCANAKSSCAAASMDVVDDKYPMGAPAFLRGPMRQGLYQPAAAIEGFVDCLPDTRTMLKWLLIGLIVYLVLSMIMESRRQVVTIPVMSGGANASEFDINNFL